MLSKTIAIYVLNYNGEQLLPECLPSILKAADKSRHHVRVHVIDNQSTDRSLEMMESHFSQVNLHRSPSNDFLCSFNPYIKKEDAEIVVLMNNDIKVDEDFLDPLIEVFDVREDAFFVSSFCRDFDGVRYEGGVSTLICRWGWWGTRSDFSPKLENPETPLYTMSIGACIAIKTQAFNALGGYDSLYLPGILEDLDLCYRGWQKGWKGYYTEKSRIYHKGQASFKPRFGAERIRKLATRNTLFFIWKNIRSPWLLLKHFFFLPLRLLAALIQGDFAFISGVFSAIIKLRLPLARRRQSEKSVKVSDRDLIKIFQSQSAYLF